MAYVTTADEFQADQFLNVIRGVLRSFDDSVPKNNILKVYPSGMISSDSLIQQMHERLDTDFVEGLSLYISAYFDKNENFIGISNYILLHEDLFLSSPESYTSTISSLFSK
jgi:hypothetical protein